MQKTSTFRNLLASAALTAVLGASIIAFAAAPVVRPAPRPVVGLSPNLVQPGVSNNSTMPAAEPAAEPAPLPAAAPATTTPDTTAAPKPMTATALTPLTPKQQSTAAAATAAAPVPVPAATPALAQPGSVPLPPNTQVTADSIAKIYQARRTLFLPFGQRMTVWEAPVGMCFLDESQYLEGQLIRQLRGGPDKKGHIGPLLVAVFADCLEVAKLEQLPQIQADGPNYGDDSANEALLLHQGTITWMTPKDPALGISLVKYLDDKEPTFTHDIRRLLDASYKESGGAHRTQLEGNLYTKTFMAAPDQFHFDSRAHRTDTSVSVAFKSETEAEYKKYATVGVVGTSLVRGMPVQVSLSSTAEKKADKTTHQLTDLLDRFFAQNVTLNN